MQASLFDSCKSYVQAYASLRDKRATVVKYPAITLSRATGAGGVTIGKKVTEILQNGNRGPVPWTFFDKNLVKKVLEDHDLPQNIQEYMPEDTGSELGNAFEEMLGLHPSSWTLFQHTTDTLLRLATAGHTVIVGRGGSIIASRLPHVLHIRLIAPLEKRTARVQKMFSLTTREARLYIEKADRGRKRYMKSFFECDIEDPEHYHMVLNTGLFTDEEAARLIVSTLKQHESTLEKMEERQSAA